MPAVTLQIEKNNHVLHVKTIEDMKISKQSIEQAVLALTGLTYGQYDVHYVDAEDDLIMTVVEQDYSIAQMTLESDTIVFHIEVKVDRELVQLQKQEQIAQSDDRFSSSFSQHGESEEEKAEEVYKSAISSQNQQQLERKVDEQLKNSEQMNMQPLLKASSQQPLPSTQVQQAVAGGVKEQKSENKIVEVKRSESNSSQNLIKLVNQVPLCSKGQIQQPQAEVPRNQDGDSIQALLQRPQIFDRLFEQICLKLHNVLKPQCFLVKNDFKHDLKPYKGQSYCYICNQQIKIPFYLNNKGDSICQKCETSYQNNEILLKIRSQAAKAELLAARYVSLSTEELSNQDQRQLENQSDPRQRQLKIKELVLQKLIRLSKQ